MLDEKRTSLIAKSALFVATIIWGSSFFILKNTIDETPITLVLAMRFFIGFAFLSVVFIKSYKRLTLDCVWKGAVTGVILAFAYIVQTIGLSETTPGKNAFITASYCVMVPFMFWIANRTRPDKYNVIAAIICFIGIGLVSIQGNFTFGRGDAVTLGSGFLFAVYIVAVAVFGRGNSPALFTIMQFLAAGIICAIGFGIFEEMPDSIPVKSLTSIIYLGIFATAGALLLQNFGQKYTNPSSASIILSFEAVFGIAFSIIFYGERIVPQTTMGFILIFIAVIVSETKLNFLLKKHTHLPDQKRDIAWLLNNPMTHRGVFDNKDAPENSLKAFEIAVQKGYNIELDIQLTADGEIVVFHDATLSRMCGVRGRIAKSTLAELNELRLLKTSEKIPTLKEVMDIVDGKVGLVIELKLIFKHQKLCEKLAEELKNYKGDYSVHSFSPYAMRWVGQNHPEWIHGIVSLDYHRFGLVGVLGIWLNNFPYFDIIKPDYIFYHCGHLDSRYIKRARARGMKVLCWTVKSGEQLAVASEKSDNYLCEGAIIEQADKRKSNTY